MQTAITGLSDKMVMSESIGLRPMPVSMIRSASRPFRCYMLKRQLEEIWFSKIIDMLYSNLLISYHNNFDIL